MEDRNTLVRMLSTGRCGTKFMARAFANQGYNSFHEDLYVGQPSSAIKLYTNMLGDLWMSDRDAYYALESNFARPYLRATQEALEETREGAASSGSLLDVFKSKKPGIKPGVVVHSGHTIMEATPMVEREFAEAGIEVLNLILYRNPLKTIHAIFQVEGAVSRWGRRYAIRPELFSQDEGFIGAANVWANTYRMADDLREHFGPERFFELPLERFSADLDFTAEVFDFLKLDFDAGAFSRFVQQTLEKPLRTSKQSGSARNSDIFHDPNFEFSDSQIEEIHGSITDVLELYQIDWDEAVQAYKAFHHQEKSKLGFA